MEQAYKQALRKAKVDLVHAIKEKQRWTFEVARLNQLVKGLAIQADEKTAGALGEKALVASAGLTDLVHAVVNTSDVPLFPKDVRENLAAQGFDVTPYRNPMAMIHQSLKRLAEQGKIYPLQDGSYKRNALYEALLKSVRE